MNEFSLKSFLASPYKSKGSKKAKKLLSKNSYIFVIVSVIQLVLLSKLVGDWILWWGIVGAWVTPEKKLQVINFLIAFPFFICLQLNLYLVDSYYKLKQIKR